MAEKWIQKAIKHEGSLRKALHVPEGKNIPSGKLDKASHSENPALAKKANFHQRRQISSVIYTGH